MQPIGATNLLTPSAAPPSSGAFADLGSQDFLKLMLTELTNQDPLQPTDNEALLRQISSIRDIELSTSLTDSLKKLTGQSAAGGIGAASSLIGQFVTSAAEADGTVTRGVVVGVRFADGGKPVLMLSSGVQLPLDQVGSIEPPQQAAENLIGQSIVGVDRRKAGDPRVVEGVVTGMRVDEKGETLLELDTGSDLRLRDLVDVVSGDSAS